MSQKEVFLASEGDAWHARNRDHLDRQADAIADSLELLGVAPRRVLEIGCANGHRLDALRRRFGAAGRGIDPSAAAIAEGRRLFPDITLETGTADALPFADAAFDLVIFGFCLYLCDPKDHFLIAREADRVLADPGWLVVKDFNVVAPYRNEYAHKPGLYSHKMAFSNMFLWHPGYRLLHRHYTEHNTPYRFQPDDAVTVDLLRKDMGNAFPVRRD